MATAAAKADVSADGAAAPSGNKKTVLIIIVAVVVALVAGGAAAWFLLRQTVEAQVRAAKKDTEFITVEPAFTVNLAAGGEERFLQAGIVYEISNKKTDAQLKQRLPLIRSGILLLLSGKTTKELLTADGKRKLATEILELTRAQLDVAPPDHGVEGVHFAVFLIQ